MPDTASRYGSPLRCGEVSGERSASARKSSETSARCAASDSSAPSSVQFLEIEAQHAARLHPQRAAHHLGGDERIAVAIAADPASHPQERRQFARRAAIALVQPVLERAMQPRHLVQEGVIVERQAVGDFVEHGELGPAQQVGLPQRQHLAAQLLVARPRFPPASADPFAPVEQGGDLHLAVDRALAAHFGRMRGQHRADQRVLEEAAQIGRR